MNINYLKSIDRLKLAAADIQKFLAASPKETFDDRQVFCIFEGLLSDLQSAIAEAEYFTKPTVGGNLQEMDNNKFELISAKGKPIGYFCSGSPIEVYSHEAGQWFAGRVEYKMGRYYFHCKDLGHPALYSGMKVRLRITP